MLCTAFLELALQELKLGCFVLRTHIMTQRAHSLKEDQKLHDMEVQADI